MTKLDFLYGLRDALRALPREDIERYVEYYSEMIDDRVEDGMTESDAISELGSIEEIAARILGDTAPQPSAREVKEPKKEPKKEKRPTSAVAVLLIVLGFPLWFPLLVAAFSVLISLVAVLFSLVITLWAVEVSLWGCAIGGLVSGAVAFVIPNISAGLMLVGIALFCTGLSVFGFYGCKAATKGAAWLVAKAALAIKSIFVRREVA